MNAWHYLGVERSATSKEIKQAYAQKLKVTRPDQMPAEFQLLHQAYKIALNYARQREGKIAEKLSDSLINAAVETAHLENLIDDELSNEETAVIEMVKEVSSLDTNKIDLAKEKRESASDLSLEITRRQEEYKRLIAEVERLLQKNSISRDVQEWHFLANSPYVLENEFNSYLGRDVFYLLSKYGQTRVRRTRGKYYKREVPRSLIRYCDEIFSWRNRARYLANDFGQDFCRLIFSKLDDNYNSSNAAQGVRGGTIVHEVSSSSSQAGPTRKTESHSNYTRGIDGANSFLIIMALMGLMNLLRNCSPSIGH